MACAGGADSFIAPEALRDLQKAQKVKLVYFVPQDREPATNYAAKISVLMTFVADVYRRDLTSKGFASRGFDFEFERGEPRVHLLPLHSHQFSRRLSRPCCIIHGSILPPA